MKIKIKNVPGYSGTVKVETDQAGTPIAKFWRRRLKDAKIDKCIEIVKPKKRMIK